MDGEAFATYLRRVRETDSPRELARLRQELDADRPPDRRVHVTGTARRPARRSAPRQFFSA